MILTPFEHSAARYNDGAGIQRRVAHDLGAWVMQHCAHVTHLCDVAAGTGFVGEALPPSLHYTAVDPSPTMLSHIRRPAVRVVGCAEALPFAPYPQFDVITCSMGLPWFSDPKAPLSWRPFLRPQGFVVIRTLGDGSFAPFYYALGAVGRADKIIPWPSAEDLMALWSPAAVTVTRHLYETEPLTLRDFLWSLKTIGAHRHPARWAPLRPQEMLAITQDTRPQRHPYVIHQAVVSFEIRASA
ncbi:MAG: class I SAM-dependent methyltransferase [Alphaproteobacteria bacterium]